jgi:hypothetical protein
MFARVILTAISVCVAASLGASGAAETTPSQAYLDRLLAANAAAVAELDHYVRIAEDAAELLVRDPDGPGPSLWLAGDEGFVLEGSGRAGGMMTAKRLTAPDAAAAGDVALVGSLDGDDDATVGLVRALVGRGVMTILFAPRDSGVEGSWFIAAHADSPGESDLPTASPAIAQSLWAFTGELVSAMMRSSGRTPPLYVSVLVPDGRERNSARKGMRWDPQNAEPMAPGVVGRRYLARLANSMRAVRATQAERFAEAGQRAAQVLRQGGTVWLAVLGHMLPAQGEQIPPEEMPFTVFADRDPEALRAVVKPGDLMLYVGYYEPLGAWVETMHELGGEIVTVVSGTPERPADAMGAEINIRGCWPYGDAAIALEPRELGLTMLPPSGVVQSAAVWMLLAETRQNRPWAARRGPSRQFISGCAWYQPVL